MKLSYCPKQTEQTQQPDSPSEWSVCVCVCASDVCSFVCVSDPLRMRMRKKKVQPHFNLHPKLK